MSHKFVRKLLQDAKAAGLTFQCVGEGEVDYDGDNVAGALEALTACDEMELYLFGTKRVGWALIIPGLDPDEQIADYSGEWIDAWWKTKMTEGTTA